MSSSAGNSIHARHSYLDRTPLKFQVITSLLYFFELSYPFKIKISTTSKKLKIVIVFLLFFL